jgi:hypothetical protein
MKSISSRLEKVIKNLESKQPTRIFIHYKGDDFGMCEGKKMTLAEWDAIKSPDCVTIHVCYDKADSDNHETN